MRVPGMMSLLRLVEENAVVVLSQSWRSGDWVKMVPTMNNGSGGVCKITDMIWTGNGIIALLAYRDSIFQPSSNVCQPPIQYKIFWVQYWCKMKRQNGGRQGHPQLYRVWLYYYILTGNNVIDTHQEIERKCERARHLGRDSEVYEPANLRFMMHGQCQPPGRRKVYAVFHELKLGERLWVYKRGSRSRNQ